MELRHLEFFLQLKKYENVSLTADFLNISQPALSKYIKQLEDELGVKLFDRVGRHIYLNGYGETFARYAEQTLLSLHTGIIATRHIQKNILGSITIGLYSYGSIISPCIKKYSKLNPHVNFKISYNLKFLSHNSLDGVDFLLSSVNDPPFNNKDQFWVTKALFHEDYVVVLSPILKNYPEEQTSIDLLTLKNEPFVVMPSNENVVTDVTFKYCHNAGFAPNALYETDEFVMKMNFIKDGLAVGILPESCIRDAKAFAPELRFFTIENFATKRTILIKRRKKVFMTDATLSFWDFLLDYFNVPPDRDE